MSVITCSQCQRPYPQEGMPYRCKDCGGAFRINNIPVFRPADPRPGLPGFWRYRENFQLFPGAVPVSLGEGNTPLVWLEYQGQEIGLKVESLNPTGSYKDRGTSVLLSQLKARGVKTAIEDSSGNAGASFAAYAAAAGIQGRVYVPAYASGAKRKQIEAYGGEVVAVPGERQAATEAALADVASGSVYASHAWMPFGLLGIATLAYELHESMPQGIGTVVMPIGHGGLLRGVLLGFEMLKKTGLISEIPHLMGVQSWACAPLVKANRKRISVDPNFEAGRTIAEGIMIKNPIHAEVILQAAREGVVELVSVEEADILNAHQELAQRGHFVEPTSAVVWAALPQIVGSTPGPIILVLTGHGLKAV